MFRILKSSRRSRARITRLTTRHGVISGPFFMPIATRAAVKNLTTPELESLGAQIVLSNTYHLLLRPGTAVLKKVGGLHTFMHWPGPILTDSGGFQVFSLANHRRISENGVQFADPQTGQRHILTPEKAVQIQAVIGSDIAMVLDECPAYPCTKEYAATSAALTTRWAQRSLVAHRRLNDGRLLFGIVQGSVYRELRQQSARELVDLNFDGYAIGGVAVGEPRKKMRSVLDWVVPLLPGNKPRYLMGVGRPEEIVAAVKAGIDMFDCVIPTREARHGRLYMWRTNHLTGRSFYRTIHITNARWATNTQSVNHTTLRGYSFAYLHHLFKTNEPLAMRLASIHNIEFYLTLMARISTAIRRNEL